MRGEMDWEQTVRYNQIRAREDAWTPYIQIRRLRWWNAALSVFGLLGWILYLFARMS